MAKHITGNTTTPTGIIPFGSDDESVVFQSSLKSATSVTGVTGATGTVVGATATYDSELGFNCGGVDYLKFAEPDNYSLLEQGGQISFEIEAFFIATVDTGAGADGIEHTVGSGDHYISWAAADASAVFGRCFMDTGERNRFYIDTGSTGIVAQYYTNVGSSRFKRVTLSWYGGQFELYTDGASVSALDGATLQTDLFKNIYIGGFRGGVLAATTTFYIRNLIVSNRPVMTPTHPMFASVPWGGDSFADRSFPTNRIPIGTKGFDHAGQFRAEAYMRDRGIGINLVNRGTSGSVANTTSGTNWAASANGVLFLSDKAAVKFIQLGTNDAALAPATFGTINFDTDYKAVITSVMATCDYLVIGTVPSVKGDTTLDTVDYVSQVATCNTTINSIPAWWDANGGAGGREGAIRVADTFTHFGGESPVDTLTGLWTGALDDLHPSSKGYKIMGEGFAEQALEFLSL